MKKKLIACITGLAIVAIIAPSTAQAVTAAELQAQINALLETLAGLQSQLADLTGEPTGGTIAGCTITSFTRNLKVGMSGDDVKCLQIVLNSASDTQLSAGVGSPGQETSYFGPKTKAAVIKFQEKYAADVLAVYGLTSGTGYVGSTTRAKLNALLAPGEQEEEEEEEEEEPVADGLTVSLASDTPAAAAVVADSTSGDGGQALVDFLKIKFSVPSGTSAKVTTLKITRSGISSDTDLPNMYLFDGSTKVADTPSASDAVFTFTNADGLFTIGSDKVITVKADIVNQVSAGKTIALSVASVDAVVTNASAVNGSFPIQGKTMTTASITNLGKLTLAHVTGPGSSITAGLTDQELWRFSLVAADQKIKVSKIKFTVVGTIDPEDLGNLYLSVDGAQLGSTVATLEDDKTVTFDFSDTPYEIAAGVTKQISLRGDLIGGASRTFYFSVRDADDIIALDTNYDIYIRVNQTSTYTIIYDETTTSISAGTIQITKRSDSPSGNIARSATNVLLAEFDVKAIGEQLKITTMTVTTTMGVHSDLTAGLNDGKILIDGVQVGNTTDLVSASGGGDTAFTLGSQFIVDAGETKTLAIYADVLTSGSEALDASTTIKTDLKVGSNNFLRMNSGTTDNTPATTANTLTVTAAALSSIKNVSIGNPTVTQSSTDVLLGSWLVTAGAAEGADINSVAVVDRVAADTGNGGYALGDAFQNLTIWSGGVQYGQIITSPSVTEGTKNTFSFSSSLRIAAGNTIRIDLRGDVKGNANSYWTDTDCALIDDISGVGLVTTSTITDATGAIGQQITVATAGTLTMAGADTPTMPNNQLAVMGDTGMTLGAWDFSASAVEPLTVTRIEVREYQQEGPGNVQNLKLFVAGAQVPTASPITISALNTNTTSTFPLEYAIFEASDGLFDIPAGETVTVTLKGDITDYANATAGTNGANLRFRLVQPATITATSSISAEGTSSGTFAASSSVTANSNITKTVRTKPTIALVGTEASQATLVPGTIKVFEFTVTADDAYKVAFDGSLHNIRFTIVSTQSSGAARAWDLYDAATDTTIATQLSVSANSGLTLDFTDVDTTIPVGQTKTYYVKGNLTDFSTAGNSFQLQLLNAAADLSYGDGQIASDDINQASYQGLGTPIDGKVYVMPG